MDVNNETVVKYLWGQCKFLKKIIYITQDIHTKVFDGKTYGGH